MLLKEEKIAEIDSRIEKLKQKEYKAYVVWGAGEHTVRLFQYTNLSELPIKAIVDKKKVRTHFCGYSIIGKREVKWEEIDAIIISSVKFQKDIQKEIKEIAKYSGEVILLYESEFENAFYRLQSKTQGIFYEGDFLKWEDAEKYGKKEINTKGYEDIAIFEDAIKHQNTKSSICEYFHLIAYLLEFAIKNDNTLCVLDLGGGLGGIYNTIKEKFKGLKNFSWIVIEQKHFVTYGKQHLENSELSFAYNLEEAAALEKGQPTVVLCSGVLSYLHKYEEYISQILNINPELIIIDRQLNACEEKIFFQKRNAIYRGYIAGYTCRCVDKEKLLQYFKNKYKIKEIFSRHENVCFEKFTAYYDCFVFEKKMEELE